MTMDRKKRRPSLGADHQTHFRVKIPPNEGQSLKDPRTEHMTQRKDIKRRSRLWVLPDEYSPFFLDTLDRRSHQYLRIKRNYEVIVNELGGQVELSLIQMSLIEHFVFLLELIQYYEVKMIDGMDYAHKELQTGRFKIKGKVNKDLSDRLFKAMAQLQSMAKVIGLKKRNTQGKLRAFLSAKNA